MRILLAEDDKFLSDGLQLALSHNGYALDLVRSGSDADHALTVNQYDLLILDLGLPDLDGMEVLRRLRGRGQGLPVLILTARDGLDERVSGLDLGANDYLTKPFDLPELEARIRALLRKDNWANQTEIHNGPLTYHTVNRQLYAHNEPVELSARELAALEMLIQRVGTVVTKEQMSSSLSSLGEELTFNAVEIVMHRLRKKLESSGCNIKTIRGLGYMMEKAK